MVSRKCILLATILVLYIVAKGQTIENDSVIVKQDSLVSAEIMNKMNAERTTYLNKYHRMDTFLNKYEDHFDKIYLKNWTLYIVRIKTISEKNVRFNYPLNSEIQEINRKDISQIIYADGRHDFFAYPDTLIEVSKSSSAIVQTIKDWEKVQTTNNEEDINENFKLIEQIEAFYEADRINASTKFLEKNATIILRRKAAAIGGSMILITDKKSSRVYGELPKIEMKAKVYTLNE